MYETQVKNEGPHRGPSLRVTPMFGPQDQEAQDRGGGEGKRPNSRAVLESGLNSESALYWLDDRR